MYVYKLQPYCVRTKKIIFSCFFWAKWSTALSRAQHQHAFFSLDVITESAHQVFSNGDERAGKMSARILSAGALTIFSVCGAYFFLIWLHRIIVIVFQQKQWGDRERGVTFYNNTRWMKKHVLCLIGTQRNCTVWQAAWHESEFKRKVKSEKFVAAAATNFQQE